MAQSRSGARGSDSVGSRVIALLGSAVGLVLILLVFSTVVVATNVAKNPEISPLDEYVYLDYLSKVPTQGFVRSGEETGELARQEIACRGVLGYGIYGDPCEGTSFDADPLYPYGGRTGADIYAPVYFAVTWVAAQPLVAAGVGLLDAGRLVNILWLSAGAILLLGLLRTLGVRRGVSLGLVLLTMATPAVFWSTTYVSTDAPSLAVSAGLAWAGVAIYRGRLHPLWLPLLGVMAVLFKVQNLAIVGLTAGALLVMRVLDRYRAGTGRRLLADRVIWVSVGTVVAGLAAQVAWLAFRSAETVPGTEAAAIVTSQAPLTLRGLLSESVRFISAVGASGPSDVSPDLMGVLVVYALSALSIAAILVALLRPAAVRPSTLVISAVTLVVALATGPALVIATYVLVGYYIPLPARYGMVLLPAFLACIALFLGSWGRRGSGAIAVVGAAAALVALAT